MSSSFRVRVAEPADAAALVELYARCHRRATTQEHWRWKLLCVESRFSTAFVAEREGRAIGHYGGFPLRLRGPAGVVPAVMGCDAMVDPQTRRGGVLTRLLEAAHGAWAEAGAAMILGLPNEQWGSRIEAFRWQYLFPLRWLKRPLRPVRLLARRMRGARRRIEHPAEAGDHIAPPSKASTLEPCAAAVIDRTSESLAASARISIVRDSAWVAWRFAACPDYVYRVVPSEGEGDDAPCYGVCRMPMNSSGSGLIVDVAGADHDRVERRRLIRTLLWRLKAAGADSAAALAVPGTPVYRDFVRTGFVPRSAAFDVRAVVLDSDFDSDDLTNPQRWAVAGGDFDVV